MSSKTIYQHLFECWPEPRFLIEACEGGYRVLHANAAGCEYFLHAPDTLDGVCVNTLLEAANKDHVLQSFDVCFKSGLPLNLQIIPSLPGGVRLRTFFLNPLKDEGGKTFALDMTARLAAPSEDASQRERDDALSIFSSIFDASDLGVIVTDHHRRVVRVNDAMCRLSGYDRTQLIGEEFTMLVPEDARQFARDHHDAFLTVNKTERGREIRVLHQTGSIADALISSGVIELSGQRRFRISTLVDITALKQIERDLRAAKDVADSASHAKSSFLANMSHELRTPLNAIIGFSDLMMNGTLGRVENPHYREYLGDIHFSATHLLAIINDVLDMSKIEAGQMKIDTEPSDVLPLLEEVSRLMRTRAREAGINIAVEAEAGLAKVNLDQRMFRQVMLNLLSNAIKFSHGGGTVSLRANPEPDGQWLRLDVADQGIGIPEERMGEVMSPFGQISDPRIAKGQGTGLGLPLARAMVELHGGRLEIASVPDKGTTVTCLLPLN